MEKSAKDPLLSSTSAFGNKGKRHHASTLEKQI